MSEEAEGLFVGMGEPTADQGTEGTEDAAMLEQAEGEGNAALESFKEVVDVSTLSQATQGVLSALPPETQAAVLEMVSNEKKEIHRGAQTKFQEAAALRREADNLKDDAEFGRSIRSNPDLMARFLGIDQQQQQEPQIDWAETDISTPEGRRAFVEGLKREMGVDSIAQTAEDRATQIVNSTPEVQAARFRMNTERLWRDLASEGKPTTPAERKMIGEALLSANSTDRLIAMGPDQIRAAVEPLVTIAKSLGKQTGTRATRAPQSALPRSGGVGANVRSQKPWEEDGKVVRKPTPQEVFKSSVGGTPDEMERALAEMLGRPPP